MKLSLAIVAALILVPSIATAEKKPKAHAVKVRMCESVDLYFGPVSSETRHERIAYGCFETSPSAAQKKIQACNAQGSERCETVIGKDRVVNIEHKIQATKGAE